MSPVRIPVEGNSGQFIDGTCCSFLELVEKRANGVEANKNEQEALVQKAIEALEKVRQRPAMFFHQPSEASAEDYLSGFATACHAFGLPIPFELRREATYMRGWGFPSVGPVPEMRERGYSEQEIVDELLVIEIMALKLMCGSASDQRE